MKASKVNYDNSLINYLQNVLGIAMIGDIQFECAEPGAQTATGFYRELENWGVPDAHIFETFALAYAATVTARNDVVVVMPGAVDEAAETTWSNSNTHAVGMSGPAGSTDYYMAGTVVYTDTTTAASVVDITGYNNQFHNIAFNNNGAGAGALTAIRVAGYQTRMVGCNMTGIMNSTQRAVATASSLLIASGCSNSVFDNCTIGHNVWGARTQANQGHLYFGGTTESGASAGQGPQNLHFKDCRLLSQGTTVTVPLVRTSPGGTEAIDRECLFENCSFGNFNGVDATLNAVISDPCQTWHNILLRRCTAYGYEEWQVDDLGTHPGYVSADMPITGVAGGHARMPTGAHDSGT